VSLEDLSALVRDSDLARAAEDLKRVAELAAR
jgi:hypothetical protein